MSELIPFTEIFKSGSEAQEMGKILREIVFEIFPNCSESIAGGKKVKLALYSIMANKMVCGIQEGANDTCMLYVHHISELEHQRLRFSGSGKHAKRVKFHKVGDINHDDIRWLLQLVRKNIPS